MVTRAEATTIVFLVFVAGLLIGVAYYQNQLSAESIGDRVTISQFSVVTIESVGISSLELLVQFNFNNPTPVSATLENASYVVFGNVNYFGAGQITEHVKISAHASTSVETNFTVGLSPTSHVLWSYISNYGGNILWEARGNATLVESFLGQVTIHFDCKSLPPQDSITCPSVTGISA